METLALVAKDVTLSDIGNIRKDSLLCHKM